MPECVKPRLALIAVESMWKAGLHGLAAVGCKSSVPSVNSLCSMSSKSSLYPRSATLPSASQ
eukprot:6194149-Pleurochrysis_carterae.AAC.1